MSKLVHTKDLHVLGTFGKYINNKLSKQLDILFRVKLWNKLDIDWGSILEHELYNKARTKDE